MRDFLSSSDPCLGPGIQRRKQPVSQNIYRRFLHKYFSHDLNFELQAMARREGLFMYVSTWPPPLHDGTVGIYCRLPCEAAPAGSFLDGGGEGCKREFHS